MGRRPQSHRDLEEVIGREGMIRLCREYGGTDLYIPKLESITGERDAQIIRGYDGQNARELAWRFGLSESRIYQIVQGQTMRPLDGQITMEEMLAKEAK